MATLEQIEAALRKADAAGNTEDARRLAAAYKEMKGAQAAPAPTTDLPADLATLPVPGYGGLSASPPDAQAKPEYVPSSMPVLDRVNAFANSAVDAIPIVGPALTAAGQHVDAAFNNALGFPTQTAADRAAINAGEKSEYPIESGAGWAAGTVGPLMGLGATQAGGMALGTAGNLATRVGMGALSGGAIAGADAAARGADPLQVGDAIGAGLVAGGAFPLAAKAAQGLWKGVSSALSGAVSGGVDRAASSAIKSVASDLFQKSDAAGIGVAPEAFNRFASELTAKLGALRVNGKLDPKATGVLEEFTKAAEEVTQSGRIDLGQLHILRQIAQAAAQSTEGRDQMLNSVVIDSLDDFLGKLTPADVAGATDPKAAVGMLQSAIENWHVAKKTSIVEEALYRAQNQASGAENGLRTQFRAILNNPQKRANFTPDELAQIEAVANGTVGANALRLIGKFGFGGGSASNALGGFMGGMGAYHYSGGSPLLTGGFALGASAARLGSEAMTSGAANKVLQSVARMTPAQKASLPSVLRAYATEFNSAPANALGMAPATAGLTWNLLQ